MSNRAGAASDRGTDCATSSVGIASSVCASALVTHVSEVTKATSVAARGFMIGGFDEGAAVYLDICIKRQGFNRLKLPADYRSGF